MATDASSQAVGFSLLHAYIVLQHRPDFPALERFIRGEVARLADGRTVCRWPVTWKSDGTQTWGYRAWSEGENVRLPLCTPQPDWLQWIAGRLNNLPCFVLEPPSEDVENRRFRLEWPKLATRLGLDPAPGPQRLFEPGKTWFPKKTLRGDGSAIHIGADFFRLLVDQHAGGDFGLNGSYADVPLHDPDVAWTLWERPVDVQNSAAIQTRCGLVKSAFRLPPDVGARFAWQAWEGTPIAEIATAIGRSGNLTSITIGSRNESGTTAPAR